MDLRTQLHDSLGSAYRIERELGGGGMSRVFLAEELRLHRKVVIKVLSPELAAGVSGDRFEREIQLAASLQQANIVPILAAGRVGELPFYTMPFVEGESLRTCLAVGPLPSTLVMSVVRDVAKALGYAHKQGVVHRDIKPDNVLLSGGTAVVTDFGIAKAISAARTGADGATLTQLGTSIGTPAYMSPEQAAGDPSVDHRSDLYSLGCMAFELLAGKLPFPNRTPARMLAAHLAEMPPDLRTLRADLPPGLGELVMRCLAKEPGDRPQSASDLVAELDAIGGGTLAGTAAHRAPPTLGRILLNYAGLVLAVAILARAAMIGLGLPDWVFGGAVAVALLGLPLVLLPRFRGRRRPWLAGAMGVGAFALVVTVVMVLRLFGIGPGRSLLAAGRLAQQERLLVTEFQSPDTSLSTLVTEAVRTTLAQSRVISLMPPVAITAALARMQRPADSRLDLPLAREIAQREGIRAIVDGSVRTIGSDYVLTLSLVAADSAHTLVAYQETASGSRELLERIDALTRRLRSRIGESLKEVRASPPLERVTTPSLEALRIYAEAARDIDRGGSPIEAAARLREAVRIDSQFAMAYRKLGVALSNSGLPRIRVDSALELAYRYRDRLTERERLLAEGTYFQLGPGRDRGKAIAAYERLLALDPTESGAANNLGGILMGRRQYERAESLFRAEIERGYATVQQYTNLVGALIYSGKLEEAEAALAEMQKEYPGSPFVTTTPPQFLYARGQLDSMVALFRTMAESQNPILRVNGVAGLANHALLRGRIEEMRRYGMQAKEIASRLGQPSVPLTDSLQLAFLDLGIYQDTAAAVARMERTLAGIDVAALPFDQRPYLQLGAFFAAVGDPNRGRQYLARFDAELPDTSLRRVMRSGRDGVLGAIAAAEGKFDEAIRLIWRADTTYDGPSGACEICVLDDVGIIWKRAGSPDSAIVYLERYLNGSALGKLTFDAGQRPGLLEMLGELYEQKGDKVRAARAYREFIALWEKADPRLQPRVARARERLRTLAEVEG